MKKSNFSSSLLVAGMCQVGATIRFVVATPADEDNVTQVSTSHFALVNESGKEVNNLPGTFGMYYLEIAKAQGKWKLESTTPFLALDESAKASCPREALGR